MYFILFLFHHIGILIINIIIHFNYTFILLIKVSFNFKQNTVNDLQCLFKLDLHFFILIYLLNELKKLVNLPRLAYMYLPI